MPTDLKSRPRLIAKIREEIHSVLGCCCAICGSTDQLEVDHPYGRDYKIKGRAAIDSYAKWLRYRKELKQNLIRLLCKDCNLVHKPNPERKPRNETTITNSTTVPTTQTETENPF
jgi:hypothetical protein